MESATLSAQMPLTMYLARQKTFEFFDALVEIAKDYPLEVVERWDDADIVMKPTITHLNFATMRNLKFFNNLLTSHDTLTEKSAFLKTGLAVMGERFFEVSPYTTLSADIKTPPNYLPAHPTLGHQAWIVKPTHLFGGQGVQVFWDLKSARNHVLQH